MAKPPQMIIVIRIMWAKLIIVGLVLLIRDALAVPRFESATLAELIPLFTLIVIFALAAGLIHAVSAGRNWARIVYGIIEVAAVAAVLFSLLHSQQFGIVAALLRITLIAIYALVLYLLFHPSSTQWFKQSIAKAA